MMNPRTIRPMIEILSVLALFLIATAPLSATQYSFQIDTSTISGTPGALVLDFTSTDQVSNTMSILNFAHDGLTDLPETEGGLVQGDIILLLNPAPVTTIEDGFFFNKLLVPFLAFGSSITFTLQITENPPAIGNVPLDEFSLFLLDNSRQPFFETSDSLEADALVAICVDGTTSGLLNVFDPAVLTPPDQIGITVPLIPPLFVDGFESGDTSAWN